MTQCSAGFAVTAARFANITASSFGMECRIRRRPRGWNPPMNLSSVRANSSNGLASSCWIDPGSGSSRSKAVASSTRAETRLERCRRRDGRGSHRLVRWQPEQHHTTRRCQFSCSPPLHGYSATEVATTLGYKSHTSMRRALQRVEFPSSLLIQTVKRIERSLTKQ